MTNVYWVHMPRNVPLPPPEDGNASSSITSPEVYLTNEPDLASVICTGKHLFCFNIYILKYMFNIFI